MKKTLLAAASAATMFLPAFHAQAADIGVSVQVSQPGVYGRIDIGSFPQPAVVVAQPVIIQQPRVVPARPAQPIYMWVPPGHQKHWDKHCGRYNACGVPVYFVKDDWYHQHVMGGRSDWAPPHGVSGDGGDAAAPGNGGGNSGGKGHGKGHGKGGGKKD